MSHQSVVLSSSLYISLSMKCYTLEKLLHKKHVNYGAEHCLLMDVMVRCSLFQGSPECIEHHDAQLVVVRLVRAALEEELDEHRHVLAEE